MAFVVSDGSLAAVERAPATPLFSIRIGDNLTRDYAALWRAQPELRTVVDFLARNVAQLGLHAFRRLSDVDRQRLAAHPLVDLLERPNPSTTRFRLVNSLVHDLCIFDNAFWLKVRVDGKTLGVRRIRPQRVIPLGANWLEPEEYQIYGTRATLTVPASSLVHFRGYNPTDDRVGSPPIESLRQILAEEWAANVYREQLWRNGTRAAGYIQRPADAPDWGSKGRERFRKEWNAQYTGNATTAGSTPILEDGMTYVPAGTSPRDAQYIESRKLTREEVARSFHVPLPMVGLLEHATFSNIREQHKNLYQDCLGPWLQMIVEDLELQLVPDVPDTAGVYLEFNINEKLRGSFEEQAAQLQASVGGPYMTRNEARARLNLPQLDGGDELITPLNVTATGSTGPEPPPDDTEPKRRKPSVSVKARAPQAVTDTAASDLAKFFKRQGQVVLSALGADKAKGRKAAVDDVFDADRWNDELAADLMRVNNRIASSAARLTAQDFGEDADAIDPAVMTEWLAANATGVAKVLNTVTAGNIGDRLTADDPLAEIGRLFASYAAARAVQIAATQTAAISGFGTVEAAKQLGGDEVTKTWLAGPNARPSHAALNGQTVGLHDTFSNGARWPADSNLDADEAAGCNCSLQING